MFELIHYFILFLFIFILKENLEKQRLDKERNNRIVLRGRPIGKRINFNENKDRRNKKSQVMKEKIDELDIILYK